MKSSAFSLLELSIVLVIIGLIAGGITVGADMVRAAELRAVITEVDKFRSALYTFRDKYMALPGDMKNATAFWGKDNTNCSGDTGTAATPGTCNGDSSGYITGDVERFRFWQHLALAGMVEGTFTGLGSGAANNAVPGTNIPLSRLGGQYGFDVLYYRKQDYGWVASPATTSYHNEFRLGWDDSSWGDIYEVDVFTAPDAWSIDAKADDGKPGSGTVFARAGTACASTADASTAVYNLSTSGKICGLMFVFE